jgi:hypothetical protein
MQMWEYITLIISSILAIIGAALNTENDKNGKRKTVFKQPNSAGLIVICLLIISSISQLIIQLGKDHDTKIASLVAENRRIEELKNFQALLEKSREDSVSFKKQFGLMDTSYQKQITVLTTSNNILSGTDTIILKTKILSDTILKNFQNSFQNFQKIINQSKSLLHPLLPMIVRFSLKYSFHDKWMQGYVKRIYQILDSLNQKQIQLEDVDGVGTINFGDKISELRGFEVDPKSIFYMNDKFDKLTDAFLDPKFYLSFYKDKLPPILNDNPSPQLQLGAEIKTKQPWPLSPFDPKDFYIDLLDSCIKVNIYYKIDNYPNKATIIGVDDLIGKYLNVSPIRLNLDYTIERLIFFTGKDFSNYCVINFVESQDILHQKNTFGVEPEEKEYEHKITADDLK